MAAVTRLGVLGGTFDPIHIGHLLMAQAAYEALDLDLVLFVPAGVPPHKRKQERGDVAVRLEMTRAAVAGDERFTVSLVDLERPAPHFTVDTLALLAEKYDLDADSIYFIMGSDSLEQLHTWHRAGDVARGCMVTVIARPGHPICLEEVRRRVPETVGRVITVEMPEVGISSTGLRAMIARGRSIRYWVPVGVESIIEREGIYQVADGEHAHAHH